MKLLGRLEDLDTELLEFVEHGSKCLSASTNLKNVERVYKCVVGAPGVAYRFTPSFNDKVDLFTLYCMVD